jgi:hypothetical protein
MQFPYGVKSVEADSVQYRIQTQNDPLPQKIRISVSEIAIYLR